MANLYVWPAIGASIPVPNPDSDPLPASGTSTPRTPYINGLLNTSQLLTYDPLGDDDTPEIDHFADAIYCTSLATRTGEYGGQTIGVAGYSTPGDGGEGIVWWDATEEDDADGITSYGTQPVGKWKRPQGPVNPRHAGAKGDGTTNDTTAFNTLRAYCIAQNPRPVEVYIPPGDYLITHPRWWKGIYDLTVRQYGATFTNVGAWGPLAQGYLFTVDIVTCAFGDDIFTNTSDQLNGFGNKVDPPQAGSVTSEFYTIATVAAGSASVTTVTAAHAGNLTVGDDVLIYGYDQQASVSYPPNPKYFEYKKVTAVNAGTGVVTLDSPLRHRYRSDWTDATHYQATCGAARILCLTRDNYQIAKSLVIYGGEYKAYSGQVHVYNGAITVAGALRVALYDVKATGCVVTESKSFRAYRCEFLPSGGNGINESDKMVESVFWDDCQVHSHTQGSGVEDMKFRDCVLTGELQVRARNVTLEGCKIATLNGTGSSKTMVSCTGYTTRSVTLRDNAFHFVDSEIRGLVAAGVQSLFLVAAVPSTTEITVLKSAYPGLRPLLEQGMKLWTYNNATVNTAIITDFAETATHFRLFGYFRNAVNVGDEFRFYTCQQAVFEASNTVVGAPDGSTLLSSPFQVYSAIGGGQVGVQSDRQYDALSTLSKVTRTYVVKTHGSLFEVINGYITRLTVHVQRAASSTLDPTDYATYTLTIGHGFTPTKTFGVIDAKTAGLREWWVGGHVSHANDSGETDISSTGAGGTRCQALQLTLASSAVTTQPSEELRPLILVTVEYLAEI